MAPKKKTYNGYAMFMVETRQKFLSQGTRVSMAEMSEYCKRDWENMSDEMKESYKAKAKMMKNEGKAGKYTSIGENVEDVVKQSDDSKTQTNAMYAYIDVLLDMQPASHYLPKQKFILIHINSYTCEREGFYFPAEISMAEFSLEKGLIRMFHQLIGFDKVRTNAPQAPTADINNHAANSHKIDVFSMFPNNYTEVLLKMIGFIMNKEVNAAILNDLTLDMPPVYTAHTPIENELMITSSSLFKLFESAVLDAERSDFNNIIRVYHLDKLFMKLKNACYKVKNPGARDLALPSVAMATDSLTKSVMNTIKSTGCNFHERLELAHVCSNFFVCKWINILSTHCCRYVDVELISGRHYDFDLSKINSPVEEHFEKINISKLTADHSDNKVINEPKTLEASSLPTLEGKFSTDIQKPTWNKIECEENKNSKTITNEEDNFHQLDESKDIQNNARETSLNSWWRVAGRGRGVISQVNSNNQNQLNEKPKPSSKGRGILRNK
ncbi:hypothetical protein QTP88_028587 [Uroleucon formosanum]